MSRKSSNVGAAMLQPGRQSQAAGNISVMPAAEMPMVLTLDQLSPNPDNPRTSRNPRYDDIKASIRSRGLDTVPKVTRDPDGEPDMYIFSDGGNTRYQILSELWQETGEDRFFRVHVLFKPWPGRLQCVIGHLAENEVRGELSFIEKAQGIHKARSIYEEQMGKTVSLRQLSELLTHEGLPVHYSTVSRMEDALKYLYPWIPDLLESGLGRPQIPCPAPGSETELSHKRPGIVAKKQGSDTELSPERYNNSLSSESVLPVKTGSYDRVRKPNHYVRSITHSVNKNTYVPGKPVLPDSLHELVPAEDIAMLTAQLQALPEEQAQLVLLSLQKVMARHQLSNPVGWLLAVMKKAREGRLYAPRQGGDISDSVGKKTVQRPEQQQWKPEPRASARPVSEENIRDLVKKIRENIINS
ncbi:TPA: ParB family protein [Enterobacter hormaechei]